MSRSHAGGSRFSGRGHLATSHTCVWTVGIAHSETFIRAQDGLQGSSLLLPCRWAQRAKSLVSTETGWKDLE